MRKRIRIWLIAFHSSSHSRFHQFSRLIRLNRDNSIVAYFVFLVALLALDDTDRPEACTISTGPARRAGSVTLEVLHRPLLRLCGFAGRERAEIAAAPRLWVFLARVQAILTGLQLSNHGRAEKAVLRFTGRLGRSNHCVGSECRYSATAASIQFRIACERGNTFAPLAQSLLVPQVAQARRGEPASSIRLTIGVAHCPNSNPQAAHSDWWNRGYSATICPARFRFSARLSRSRSWAKSLDSAPSPARGNLAAEC